MIKSYKNKGYIIKKLNNTSIIDDCIKIIKKNFNKSVNYYFNLSTEDFRKIVLKCQKKLNKEKINIKIINSEFKILKKIISPELMIQSFVYLRATRPHQKKFKQEQIDFHRETFYSNFNYTKFQHNIWLPILNVNINNTLNYIPKSHKISNKKIKIKKLSFNNDVKKFSAGHKIGLLYSPKKIVAGINLSKKKKFDVPKSNYVLFSANLIHGGAKNDTNKIRFSLDFGILPQNKINKTKISFSSGKSQYIKYKYFD